MRTQHIRWRHRMWNPKGLTKVWVYRQEKLRPKHKLLGCVFIVEELQVREFPIRQIPQMMRLYLLCNPRQPEETLTFTKVDLVLPVASAVSKDHTRPNCALLPQGILTKGIPSFLPLDSKTTKHQASQCHAPNQTFWQLKNSWSPEGKGLSHGTAGGGKPSTLHWDLGRGTRLSLL